MVDDFLNFLFDFFHFFHIFDKRKVVFINLWGIFFHLDIWKAFCLDVLHFMTVNRLIFGLSFIADDTAFRSWGHKREVWIDLLLHFNFLNNHLLLNDRLRWNKVLESMRIVYRQNLRSYKRISGVNWCVTCILGFCLALGPVLWCILQV